jgi:hypothetical protein
MPNLGSLYEPEGGDVGLYAPTAWHWSLAEQTTGLAPTQAPFWHESVWVQASLSLHAVPFEATGLLHAPVAGLHAPIAWH